MTNSKIEVNSSSIKPAKERLKFIDLARSIAILLMLQGHFITLTFKDYHKLLDQLRKYGTSDSIIFDWWVKVRGFTAPLFFTITGMVFVYLLLKNVKHDEKIPFFKTHRIQKGIKRAISLIFWGYFLQLNLKYLFYFLKGHINEQIFGFHILQCIGYGIGFLITIFYFYQKFKWGKLEYYYLLSGITIFTIYSFLMQQYQLGYFPKSAPQIIQNMFNGPKSSFPLFPWIGYVMFGGFFGSLVFRFEDKIKNKFFPIYTLILGFTIVAFGRLLGQFIDILTQNKTEFFAKKSWVYDRLGEALILLSVLIFIERVIKIKNNLFLKFGQNTLPIYILHVIILYGAITGYSLKNLFKANLNAYEAIVGTIIFISFFAIYVKFMEVIHEKIDLIKQKIILNIMKLVRYNSSTKENSKRKILFYKRRK